MKKAILKENRGAHSHVTFYLNLYQIADSLLCLIVV